LTLRSLVHAPAESWSVVNRNAHREVAGGERRTEATELLGRVSMVIPQHPAESFPTTHAPEGPRGAGHGRDDRVVESLVIPLGMVMREVLHDRTSQGRFAEEDHPVEALGFDRTHESLDPSVQIRRARRQSDGFGAGIVQQRSECRRELGIAVHQAEALLTEKAVDRIGQVPPDLANPSLIWVRRDSGEVNPAASQIDGEQDVQRDQPVSAPHLDGREVDRGDGRPMGAEKCTPRRVSRSPSSLPFALARAAVRR